MDETEEILLLLNQKANNGENVEGTPGTKAKTEANELLSVTAAAVTALDSTSSSRDERGEASAAGKSKSDVVDSAKGDSIRTEHVEKTTENMSGSSQEGSEKQANTSYSSTASEILIRSTVMETSGNVLDASTSSRQATHDSFFNESVQRVKLPSKRLREIKPPFETDHNGTLDTTYGRKDSGEYVPPPLFQVPERPSVKPKKKNSCLVQGRLEKDERPASHPLDRGPWKRSNVSIERHFPELDTGVTASDADAAGPMSEISTTSSRTRGPPTMMDTGVCCTDAADESSASGESSQPEIVDVPDVIVTINAQTSVSPSSASTASEGSSLGAQIQRRYQRNVSHVVQGAPVSGAATSERHQDQDVRICKFKDGERERKARQQLARRKEEGGPLKRVVKPTFVGPEETPQLKKDEATYRPDLTESITAAVAASAAVAVTQPYIKAQQDLDTKMSSVFERLSELSSKKQGRTPEDNRRIAALERQLNDLTQKRLDFIESMQQQQLNWQANMMRQPQVCNYRPERDQTPSNYSRPHDAHRKHYHPVTKDSRTDKQGVRFSPEARTGDEDLRKGSPLDTPAPRMRPPMPTAYEDSGYRRKISPMQTEKPRGLLAEILAAHEDTPERDTSSRSLSGQGPVTAPAIKEGIKSMQPSRGTKDEVDRIIKEVEATRAKQVSSVAETPRSTFHVKTTTDETAPLDKYLMRPKYLPTSPYTTLNDITRKQNTDRTKSPVLDAEMILEKIQANRSRLEANLEMILRSQQDADVYSLIDDLARDGNAAEKSRIKKMVDETINSIKGEVQVEVEKDLARLAAEKKATVTVMEHEPVKSKSKFGVKGQVKGKGRIQARIDTGLRKREEEAEEKKKASKGLGKENVPKKPKEPPKKKKTTVPPYKDEAYMTRVYGKAIYQSHRTTVKDPYLHFKNPVSPGPRATPRPASAVEEVKATAVKTARVQTEPPRPKSQPAVPSGHFYFNPATVTTQQTHGFTPLPAEGHLIPMAIPLGPPRQGGQPIQIKGPTVTVSGHSPPRSPERRSPVRRSPEKEAGKVERLEKIVLPSMDIDSLPSGSPMQIESTPVAGQRERSALMDESSIMEDQFGEGLELPGFRQKQPRYHGPEFPPRVPHDEGPMEHIVKKRPNVVVQEVTSDMIAGDIRRRDNLERNAVDWIEQELMARIITELHSKDPEPAADPTARADETASTVSEAPSAVAEALGQAGLQLFVDAGVPVDETLVSDLLREVLLEKISGMMGRRTADQDEVERPQPTPRQPRPQPPSRPEEYDEDVEQYVYHPHTDIPTPEPTPRPSPIHSSPPQIMSAPSTPLVTPEVSIGESETESAKELSAIWGMHPVVGPQETDNEEYSLRDDFDTPVATPRSPTPLISREETPVFDARTPPCDKATSPIPILLPPETPPTPTVEVKPRTPSPQPEVEKEPEVVKVKVVSPPPLPPRHQRTPTPPLPESDSEMTESTPLVETETMNESISEGEWLISRSEGQAAEVEIDPARRGFIAQLMRGADDSSVACSDIEPDDADVQVDRSLGEFMTPKFRPEKDPVLQLIARMNLQQPEIPAYNPGIVIPQPQVSGYPQPSISRGQVPLSMVQKSLGEISIAQPKIDQAADVFGDSQAAATVRPRLQHQQSQGEVIDERPEQGRDDNGSLKLSDLRLSHGEVMPGTKLVPSAHSTPAQVTRPPPQPDRRSPMRKSAASPEAPEDLNASTARIIQVRSSFADSPEAAQERSPSPTATRVTGAVSTPVLTAPERSVVKDAGPATYPTMSEGMRTGTFTPDQLNMDALLQSGYLTQTVTDSEDGAQLGGTPQGTGEQDNRDPNRMLASGTLGQSPSLRQFMSASGKTDEESGSASGSSPERPGSASGSSPERPGSASGSSPDRPKPAERPQKPGPRVVSVTMPTAQETETETNEDISEISLGGTGEW